ncbi:MAG: alkaline phosphatase family protein [Victivallaceae bacterium]|nr:alkaline phosphatase family protein [Victivallaceae bacterium]
MKKQVTIFLFCDALGFEIVSKYHFMEKEFPFRYSVRTQLGYSSTAVPTILTGKPPTVHRHFSFFFRNPDGHSPFRFFNILKYFMHPGIIFNHHRVRHQLSKIIKWWYGFTGYFNLYQVPYDRLPFFDYCEKGDIFAAGGLKPVENLRDMLDKSGISFHISNWRNGDIENLQEAKKIIAGGKCDFLFIYTAGIDGMLHFNVMDPVKVEQELKKYASSVNELFDAGAAADCELRFFLISDHGMTPCNGSVDLKSIIESKPLRFGVDYIACYDSTMLRIYILKEGCRSELLNSFNGVPGHWLSAEEKKRFNVDFEGNLYGDEIFLLDPGIQLVPSDMSGKAIPGMHGYSPDDIDSNAAILSNVQPDFIPDEIAGFFTLMKHETERHSGKGSPK